MADWSADDPYLRGYRRRQYDREMQNWREPTLTQRDWEAPDGHPDPYLEAASERFRARAEHREFVEAFTPQIEAARQDFEQRRKDAQMIVALAEKSGVEVPEDVRLRAATESKQAQIDAILAKRVQHRKAAQRTVGARWTS
ncbi:MAG: hypothetical protein ACXVH1_18315 [Solirubrobacteraceae bacterium]